MSFFEKNLNTLKKHRPELAYKIETFKPSGNFQVITSNNPKKVPNLIYVPQKFFGYDNNDPIGVVQRDIINRVKVPNLNLFFGFGLGYEIITHLQTFRPKERVLVVIDPDLEPFYLAMQTIDLTPIISDNNVIFLLNEPIGNMFVHLHSIMMMGNLKLFSKAINIIDNPLSLRLHTDYFKSVMRHLKDAVREVLLYYGNDPWDSLIGIENTFLNINEIIENPGIKDLKGVFKGKPGVVVATGPSLNKNIDLLRGLENKAVICAADASVRVMKKYGLKPHLVTSLERVLPTAKLFEGLTEEDVRDVYLSACPVIRQETYANFPGKRIIVYRNFATFKWLDIDKGILDIGPSAANMAFKVLEFLGCDPIILIGQDLAFGEDDVTHADGATFGQKEEQYHTKRKILEVEGNYKPKIKTTDIWYKFLKYYEKDISQYSGKVINATEGGAKIPGTEIMTFKEAIEKYIKDDIDTIKTIESFLIYPSEEEKKHYRKMMIKKVEDAIDFSDQVIKEMKRGKELTSKFNKEVIEVFQKENRIDDKLAQALFEEAQTPLEIFSTQKFYEIFMHFVQSYYISTFVDIYGILATDQPPYKKNFSINFLLHDMYDVMEKLINAMKRSLLAMRRELGS